MQLRTARTRYAAHIMAGRQSIGAEFARQREQVPELHALIAAHARYRRFSAHIGSGEIIHDPSTKALLVIEHVMGDSEPLRDALGVVNILTCATGALLLCRNA